MSRTLHLLVIRDRAARLSVRATQTPRSIWRQSKGSQKNVNSLLDSPKNFESVKYARSLGSETQGSSRSPADLVSAEFIAAVIDAAVHVTLGPWFEPNRNPEMEVQDDLPPQCSISSLNPALEDVAGASPASDACPLLSSGNLKRRTDSDSRCVGFLSESSDTDEEDDKREVEVRDYDFQRPTKSASRKTGVFKTPTAIRIVLRNVLRAWAQATSLWRISDRRNLSAAVRRRQQRNIAETDAIKDDRSKKRQVGHLSIIISHCAFRC
eukprot:SAG31_NODE_4351_length_3323_cov_2.160360_2_plen_267_part_00